jgi:hypothetical protein
MRASPSTKRRSAAPASPTLRQSRKRSSQLLHPRTSMTPSQPDGAPVGWCRRRGQMPTAVRLRDQPSQSESARLARLQRPPFEQRRQRFALPGRRLRCSRSGTDRPVIGGRRAAVSRVPGAYCLAHPFEGPFPLDRTGAAPLAGGVRVAFAVPRLRGRATAAADAPVASLDLPRLLARGVLGA